MALHFLIGSALLPAGYELAFRAIGRRGPVAGGLLGLAHGLGSGAALPLMERLHPAKGDLPEHGLMAKEAGSPAPAVFVLGHAIYGAVLGSLMKGEDVEDVEDVEDIEDVENVTAGTAVPVIRTAKDLERDERAREFGPSRPE
jgi:hypothetical protein